MLRTVLRRIKVRLSFSKTSIREAKESTTVWGMGFSPVRVEPPASIQSYLNAFGGDAERASQGGKVALFERFGVRVAVGVGEPDVEAAVAGPDRAGEPAQGKVLFKPRAVDEFLKRRVRKADAPVGKGTSGRGCVETGHGALYAVCPAVSNSLFQICFFSFITRVMVLLEPCNRRISLSINYLYIKK